MTIGEKIKTIRVSKKWTQKELANKAGIAITSLQQYEYHKRKPTVDQLIKIANALDIEPNYFMSNSSNEKREKAGKFRIEQAMDALGYSLGFDAENASVWLDDANTGMSYELDSDYDTDIDEIQKSVLSYLKFRIHELIEKSSRSLSLK